MTSPSSQPAALPMSLVIPAYNRSDLLRETIDSALAQSAPLHEIIVVDDGSTDNTGDVVSAYGGPVRYIRIPNQGVQAARNTGVAAATTELVALSDSDDILEPSFAAVAFGWMSTRPEIDALFCNFRIFDENGLWPLDKFAVAPRHFFKGARQDGYFYTEIPELYLRSLEYQPFFPTGTVIRKAFFERMGGYDGRFRGVGAEDWEFTLRAISLGRVSAYGKPLTRIRKHSANISRDSLRQTTGEAVILEHGLAHHAGTSAIGAQILKSVDQRRVMAFDACFARGDFAQALELARKLRTRPRRFKFVVKRLLMALPRLLADPLWRLTQRRNFLWLKQSEKGPIVSVLEPTWDNNAHLPGTLGLLRVLCKAYHEAEINFVGGASQMTLMRQIAPTDFPTMVRFTAWSPCADRDTLPLDVIETAIRFLKLPKRLTFGATQLILCSCTATVLSALTFLGLASRSSVYLHGNANEIFEWKSRNPLRAHLQLGPALRRFAAAGGRVIVLEERIRSQLGKKFPWLASSLHAIPHPILPEEAIPDGEEVALSWPVEIGFAGLATAAKGFPEFIQLAREIAISRPGAFRFNAFGKLAPECRDLDQSVLHTRADQGLSRKDFIDGLRRQHYLFVWHKDNYYGNAASGVVYDAINLGIPLIARESGQIGEWRDRGLEIGMIFNSVSDVVATLGEFQCETEAERRATHKLALAKLRQSLDLNVLAGTFASEFPLESMSRIRPTRGPA